MSKAVTFVLLLQVLAIYGSGRVVIKNKLTGMVLDGLNRRVTIGPYTGRLGQFWTTSQGASGSTIFKNEGSWNNLEACPRTKMIFTSRHNGNINQQWNLKPDGRLIVNQYPNHVLVHNNNKLYLDDARHLDYSDQWLLVAV